MTMSAIDEIRELVESSKIFEAYKKIKALPQDCAIPDDIPVDEIDTRISLVKELRALATSDDKWTLQRDSDGIRTLFRDLNEQGAYSIRLEGAVEAPMFDLLALFHEVDLYTKWIPSYSLLGLKESYVIEEPSPVEIIASITCTVPPPFSDREVVVYCDGIDCLDEPDCKQIVVLMTSIDHETVPRADDAVRAEVLTPSGLLLTPKGDGTTDVCIIMNIDPKVEVIPSWLIDLAVRNLAYLILVAIRTASAVVKDDSYQRRMRDGSHPFYAFLRKRLAESMPEELDYVPAIDTSFESVSDMPE